jgi:LemA protein
MLSVLSTVAVLALLGFWLGASYRRLVRLRAQVTAAWKRLDDQVKRRIEIVGQTLDLARNAGIEGADLDRLARLHGESIPYRGPADAGRRNAQIDQALTAILSLMGQHGGAAGASRAISEDLQAVTGAVAAARDAYNGRAASYNRAIAAVPGNWIAGVAGFHRAERFA